MSLLAVVGVAAAVMMVRGEGGRSGLQCSQTEGLIFSGVFTV
jgi:hypothetical protein